MLKARPGHYNDGSNGNGTAQPLIGTQFQVLTGAEPAGNASQQMARQIRDETDEFARLVKDAEASID